MQGDMQIVGLESAYPAFYSCIAKFGHRLERTGHGLKGKSHHSTQDPGETEGLGDCQSEKKLGLPIPLVGYIRPKSQSVIQ